MGVVGPLLWLLFRWASQRAMRRIWLVSLPIWLAYVHGASGLGAAIEERSALAVVQAIPYALFLMLLAYVLAAILYFFAHWLAHGSLRDADPDD